MCVVIESHVHVCKYVLCMGHHVSSVTLQLLVHHEGCQVLYKLPSLRVTVLLNCSYQLQAMPGLKDTPQAWAALVLTFNSSVQKAEAGASL